MVGEVVKRESRRGGRKMGPPWKRAEKGEEAGAG